MWITNVSQKEAISFRNLIENKIQNLQVMHFIREEPTQDSSKVQTSYITKEKNVRPQIFFF